MLPQIDEMSEASFLNDTTVDNMTEYDEDEKEAASEAANETQGNAAAGAAAATAAPTTAVIGYGWQRSPQARL